MCALTKRRDWTEPQVQMMQAARRHHVLRAADGGRRAGDAGDAGLAGCTVSQHAQNLVDRLLEAETAGVPEIVQQ